MRIWLFHRKASFLSTTHLRSLSSLELNHLLQLCSNIKALEPGRQVHQQIILHGLDCNPFMTTKLVQMYADCEDSRSANLLFEKMPKPNVFVWTAILSFYSRSGMTSECIGCYSGMKLRGVVPDRYVFPKVLRACAQSRQIKVGIQVHKDVVTYGAELNLQVCNSLIDMYSKCGDVESARRILDQMVERNLLSWNIMVSGYVSNGFLVSALDLLKSMRLDGFEPDLVTWNTTMDAYCRMGQCDEAWKVFEQIREPNIISWTTLISGYSGIGKHDIALKLFKDMASKGRVFPDLDGISGILVSCRHLRALLCGQEIQAYGIKTVCGFSFYKSAGPALLTMYANCRRIRDARNVFNLMDHSDVVTWNAMILSYADLGMKNLGLDCFRKMQSMGLRNDPTTITAILPVCDLDFGKQTHAYIIKSSLSMVIPIWNAFIHMYSRCGSIKTAYSVFSNMVSRDLISWNTMIRGLGMHGFGQAALQLRQEMTHSGLRPNSVTFASVLSACSHSGLVDEGLEVFYEMVNAFGFNPEMEHFSCVVDLLARAGRLEQAVDFAKRMPLQPDKRIWGAILAASQAHDNLSIAMLASEHLVLLEPKYAGHYVTLANTYAKAGRWDDSVRVRKSMESKGLAKPSGCSWIENGN